VTLAKKIHGDLAGWIVEELASSIEATDEQLAQKLGVDVNVIRRMLNELYESRLVMYRRVRDVEQGWYLYYWRLTDDDPIRILKERLRKTLSILERRLTHEDNSNFFICPRCGGKFTFEEIADYMFHCPRCDGILEAVDNTKAKEKLRVMIEELKNIIMGLDKSS